MSNYRKGSVIGVPNNPTPSAASGIWDLNAVAFWAGKGLWPGSEGAPPRFVVRFADEGSGASDTITLPSVALGGASADRLVSIGIAWRQDSGNARTLDTVEVGATGLTRQARATGGGVALDAELWDGLVTSGTNEDIVFTFNNGGGFTAQIVVCTLLDVTGGTAVDTNTSGSSGNISPDLAAAGAKVVAAGGNRSGAVLSGITQLSSGALLDDNSGAVGAEEYAGANSDTVTCTIDSSGSVRMAGRPYAFN